MVFCAAGLKVGPKDENQRIRKSENPTINMPSSSISHNFIIEKKKVVRVAPPDSKQISSQLNKVLLITYHK
jgi:hypothetical protein